MTIIPVDAAPAGDATLTRALDALESIAHYAPGRAGVIACETLIELGVWSATVERDERPCPLQLWLSAGAAIPGHDPPGRRSLGEALMLGRVELHT
jgi:hypothetical protein